MTTSATVLPAHGRSASEARRIIEAAVEEAQLTDLVDEALLLVTELVTNAIVHAGTELELLVSTDGPTLRVEVSDRSPGAIPVVRDQPSETREGGRGIFLLDALATEWGTRHFGSGKSVWFQLGPSARAGGRAHREPVTAASRRDIAWLVGLPADLEQQLSSSQLIGELLHRLVEALRLEQGWLVAQSGDDERTWHVAAAHDVGGAELDVEKARRIAMTGSDGRMPEPHAALVLPLRGRSGVFGALVLGGPDVLSADDIAIARLVGDRLSVVLRDDRAQASQLRSRGSLALLAEASEMFAGTLDVQLAVTLAAQLVVPRFAAWSAVCTAYEHSPRLMAVAHGDESRSAALRVALSSAEGQQLAARLVADLVEQRPVLVPAAELPSSLGEDGAGDVLAVPLVARRRLLGLLLVGRAVGTSYAADDVGLLTDLARRAALAVDNARLYEERTSIAHALQASLLPPTLPTTEDVEFGARYAAAGEGNDVGGDFYDVFSMPTGGWGVAIGDVCGKGAEAAAITGMARDVLRLLTRDGIAPPAVLQRLNDVILELGERGRFCTTALGSVIPRGDGLLVRLSSAGHPPPVLVKRGGEVSLVGRSGTVLGVIEDIEVSEDEVTLLPGDALVFYTDGVTERRSATAMFGEDNLLACLRAAAGSSADVLAGRLEQEVHRFGIGASRDDLAVLVVRAKVPRLRDQPAPELRKPVNA
ncbi:MAG: SpoIIE family protein phosphatase [Actinobacteria bacterium]|nr:SpoIIE family protein phosphatase [Actinomycetota bacterium]MCA1720114.1 SpoIIE family protein phosphatase [Actinomycetota bacterium]